MANFKQFLGIDDGQYFTELNWELGSSFGEGVNFLNYVRMA